MDKPLCLLLFACVSHFVAGRFAFMPGGRPCNRQFPPNDPQCPVDLSSDPGFCSLQSEGVGYEPEYEPGPNQRSCFRTCVRSVGGDPACDVLTRNQLRNVSLPVTDAGDNYFALRLFSPGFFRTQYRKSTICRYNIQCPEDHLLYFAIINHDLDSTRDPDTGECVDFLAVERLTTNSMRKTCGVASDVNIGDLSGFNGERLRVEFRSNRVEQSRGFFMVAVCVNTVFYAQDSCMDLPSSRKKRDATSSTSLIDDVFEIREKRSFRLRHFKIPLGFAVRYENYLVTVIRLEDERLVYQFPGIRLLRVFNRVEGYLDFYKSATRDGEIRIFPGYGELQIGKGVVHFIQTEVDPRFLLTDDEIELVDDLLLGLSNLDVFANETFNIDDEIDLDDGPLPTGAPGPPGNLPALAARALQGQNACNGVVRAFSEVFIDFIRVAMPGLLPPDP